MTVPSAVNRSGPYVGNGVTTIFPYTFRIVHESHLRAIRAEAGVETILSIDVDYIVSDVGSEGGGHVALVLAPTADQAITFLLNVPFTQEIDLENQGAFNAETIESGFDLAVMRDQQLSERLDRAITIPASSNPTELQGLIADVLRIADSVDEVDTVAAIADAVVAVAGVAADVPVVSAVASAIPVVAGIAGNVSAVGAIAISIPIVAANVDDITNFSDVYQGPKSSEPTERNNGSSLQGGDLYFNTALKQMRYFDSDEWQPITAGGGADPSLPFAIAIAGF